MAIKLGAISSLPKPFKPAALLAMVDRLPERAGPQCCIATLTPRLSITCSRRIASTGRTAHSPGLTLTARLAIAMILLVAIAVFAVGWFSYRSLEQALLPARARTDRDPFALCCRRPANPTSARRRGDITTFANLEPVAGMMRASLNGGIDPVDRIDGSGLAGTIGGPAGRPDGAQAGLFAPLHRYRGRRSGKSCGSTAPGQTAACTSYPKRSCSTGRRRSRISGTPSTCPRTRSTSRR